MKEKRIIKRPKNPFKNMAWGNFTSIRPHCDFSASFFTSSQNIKITQTEFALALAQSSSIFGGKGERLPLPLSWIHISRLANKSYTPAAFPHKRVTREKVSLYTRRATAAPTRPHHLQRLHFSHSSIINIMMKKKSSHRWNGYLSQIP